MRNEKKRGRRSYLRVHALVANLEALAFLDGCQKLVEGALVSAAQRAEREVHMSDRRALRVHCLGNCLDRVHRLDVVAREVQRAQSGVPLKERREGRQILSREGAVRQRQVRQC